MSNKIMSGRITPNQITPRPDTTGSHATRWARAVRALCPDALARRVATFLGRSYERAVVHALARQVHERSTAEQDRYTIERSGAFRSGRARHLRDHDHAPVAWDATRLGHDRRGSAGGMRPDAAVAHNPAPPEVAELLHLVRENLRLLSALVARYEVGRLGAPLAEYQLCTPADVAAYLGAELAELAQEQLRVVLLDTKNRVTGTQLVYQGGINATAVRIADCFREAVASGAAAVILVHNHPSGEPAPSPEDVRLTEEVGRASDLLGIDLLDHVVVARGGHVSLRERGLYRPGQRPAAGLATMGATGDGGDA